MALKLNEKQLKEVLNSLMRISNGRMLAKKWNEKQLDIIVQYLVDGLQNINQYYCDMLNDLLGKLVIQLNETQFDISFMCLINKFKCNDEHNLYLYARFIGHISIKLNKK
ncbi:hypothetical protein RFI_37643 [Reticulomyxa filosa]|uniref:Uncharacterized protein n=1 Tax=Reticulomyxa filosa TaxID=46433 RepID=X6LCS8_RETFI|nr:hypothetical protein RFI_37643 [Reticulomyxa filosa]|eukprot:ETN99822.1 hypothetical protein RFI_37643 [Reticulomyxa filosa]